MVETLVSVLVFAVMILAVVRSALHSLAHAAAPLPVARAPSIGRPTTAPSPLPAGALLFNLIVSTFFAPEASSAALSDILSGLHLTSPRLCPGSACGGRSPCLCSSGAGGGATRSDTGVTDYRRGTWCCAMSRHMLRLANLGLLIACSPSPGSHRCCAPGLLPLFGLSEISVITGLQSLWETRHPARASGDLPRHLRALRQDARPRPAAIRPALAPDASRAARSGPPRHGRRLPDRALHRGGEGRRAWPMSRSPGASTSSPPASSPRWLLPGPPSANSPRLDARLRHRARRVMAKPAPQFTCTACGAVHRKWAGRCDACGAWNSIVEEAPLSVAPKSLGAKGRTITLTDLATEEAPAAPRLVGH